MIPALTELARRYDLPNSPEWKKLERLLSLNNGFAFVLLLVPNDDGAAVCRIALQSYLASNQRELVDLSPATTDELKHLSGRLLDYEPSPNIGALWIGRAISERQEGFTEWREAWFEASARLNQFRNSLTRQLPFPLIFVGSHWLLPALREAAPDLWSIRATVVRVEPIGVSIAPGPPQRAHRAQSSASAPDPYLALREAAKLEGLAGHELERSVLLHRAGLGFAANDEYPAAVDAFRKALDLASSHGASPDRLAEAHYQLAKALAESYEYLPAMEQLDQALPLYRQLVDFPGVANCVRTQGDIAFALSELDDAFRNYEDALTLYRRVGDIRGQANSIRSLGDVALARQDYGAAQKYYEEALLLYRRAGDLRGEASSVRNLGAIAFDRSDYDEAQRRYEEALPLYSRAGAVRGEARCIRGFGDIALARLDYERAKQCNEEALSLYRSIGAIRGQAACIRNLGEIALAQNHRGAAGKFKEAFDLYIAASDYSSSLDVLLRLAKLEPDPSIRSNSLRKATAAFTKMGRPDLADALRREFPGEIEA